MSNPFKGMELSILGSCASKVIMLLTPYCISSLSAIELSSDSSLLRLCCLLSYKNGIMTVIRFAEQAAAEMILLRSWKWSSGDIWLVCPVTV